MTQAWNIRNAHEMNCFMEAVQERGFGYRYEWDEIREQRTIPSNALAFVWYKQIAEYFGDRTPEDVRRHCKAYMGVPILMADSDDFRERYTRLIKNRFSVEEKLELMGWFPVTRLFTKKQMKEYLDTMQREWATQGINLTSICEVDYSDIS